MSQGLFTASSGIAANQAKIDVIADNISNMNTVGFKSSQINFETVFSRRLSSGSAPTDSQGGINPKEIGLGVTVGEIGRNFSNGSIQSTGRSTDLNIQGEGFFTLLNYDGSTYLSRAGNFSTDANGNLVNPQGARVIGTSSVTSSVGSTTTVQIPTKLNFTTPLAATTDTRTNIGISSGTTFTEGTFTMTVDPDGGGATVPTDVVIDTTGLADSQLSTLLTEIQNEIRGVTGGAETVTLNASGQIEIDNLGAATVAFSVQPTDTSNFPSIAGFTGTGPYTSNVLYDQSQVTIATPDDTSDTYSVTNFSISNDGALEVTYSNGAKLTVVNNTAGTAREFEYTSPSGRKIANSDITNSNSSLSSAQLQIQLATVINPKGLTSEGGNLFKHNAAAGDMTYAIGREGGMGVINSGSLEASNVDLPSEFANMILAQRGIEASSRTFSVQNEILRTIVNLGR